MEKILKCGKAEAVVNTLGGELTSFKVDGKEYVWYADSAHWAGHAPLCFPFVSLLKDNKVRFDGVEYEIPLRHGIARRSEFELLECNDESASFLFTSSEATKQYYPYDFELIATHDITEDSFKTTYRVINKGDKAMHFCIGAHPGFCTHSSIEEWKLVFEKEENCTLYYTDKKSEFSYDYKYSRPLTTEFDLKYADYDVDALICPDLNSRKVKLVRKDDGSGMEFDFTGFDVLTLWSPPKKNSPFFALEPWKGLPALTDESGEFSDKPYCITLAPGEEYTIGYSLKAI